MFRDDTVNRGYEDIGIDGGFDLTRLQNIATEPLWLDVGAQYAARFILAAFVIWLLWVNVPWFETQLRKLGGLFKRKPVPDTHDVRTHIEIERARSRNYAPPPDKAL